MTGRNHKRSLTRQAELLGISRGSLYYEPRRGSEDNLRLMRRIDELHMEFRLERGAVVSSWTSCHLSLLLPSIAAGSGAENPPISTVQISRTTSINKFTRIPNRKSDSPNRFLGSVDDS